MKEGDDEEFLRLVSDKKFNLNQYDTLKIFELFEGIRRTPLQEACYLENPYYVEKLLENGADPNVILPRGRTCLIDIVALNPKYYNEYHYEIVKLLVEYGTDISIKDQDGFTAYDYAVKYNRTELYDLLKP